MTTSRFKWINLIRWLGLAIVVIIFYLVIDLKSVSETLLKIPLYIVFLGIFLEWIFFGFEALRIQALCQGTYKFPVIIRARLVSAFLALILPGLAAAELIRVFLMDRSRPGHKFYLMLLLVSSRIYGLLSLAIVFLFAFGSKNILEHILPGVAKPFAALVCIAIALLPMLFSIRSIRLLGIHFVRQLPKKLPQRIHGFVTRMSRTSFLAFTNFGKPKIWFWAMVMSLITNVIALGQAWLIGQYVGINFDFMTWAVVLPLVAIATFLPLGIGAVGTQDAMLVIVGKFLNQPLEPFVALSLMLHAFRICGGLPGLLFFKDVEELLSRRKNIDSKNTNTF